MKSWISFLLPNDEYKEKKILYFMSEGSIVLVISLMFIFISSRYIPYFQIDLEFSLFLSIFIFIGYVFLRYIISGIEYTEIATQHSYKKEIKNIFRNTCNFVVSFILLYLIFTDVPSNRKEWIEIIGLFLSVGFIWFFTSYISLKKSYKKNKDLL